MIQSNNNIVIDSLYTNYIFREPISPPKQKKRNPFQSAVSLDQLIFTPSKIEEKAPHTEIWEDATRPLTTFGRDIKNPYHTLDRVGVSILRKDESIIPSDVMIAGSYQNLIVMVDNPENQSIENLSEDKKEIPFMLFMWKYSDQDRMPQFKRLNDMEEFIQKDYVMVDGKPFNTIISIVCFGENVAYLTHDGRVFSDCHSLNNTTQVKNKQGALIGSVLDIDKTLFHAEKIAAGGNHVLILVRERLTGKRKVLGLHKLEEIQILPKSSKDQVVDIKCGQDHSVFLTLNGYLYVCGDNTYQQTGKKKAYVYIMDVMKVTLKEFNYDLDKIKQVNCGQYFTVVITNKGRVYTTIQNIGRRKIPKQEECGFYELEYFNKHNIAIRQVYVSSDAIILQSKNQLYYYGVIYERAASLIGRVVIANEVPKPILFDSLKQYSLHIYSCHSSQNIFVKRVGSSHQIEDFFEKLLYATKNSRLSDLIIV